MSVPAIPECRDTHLFSDGVASAGRRFMDVKMGFYFIQDGHMRQTLHPPAEHRQLAADPGSLLPPLISDLHAAFRAWGDAGLSPAPVTATRIWVSRTGRIAAEYPGSGRPTPLLQVGPAPDLAAWLVLLDSYMETYVVVARARAIWTVNELAGALSFMNAAYLPRQLVATPGVDWMRTAQTLSVALADGPLAAMPQNRHWEK